METINYGSPRGLLIDIQAIPDPYRNIFSGYPSFNKVQSSVFHDVLYTDQSIALSAPTGSGKTVIFELAIVRQLIAIENSKYSNIFKIVYISPMKALCEERLIDWHKKFSSHGVNCISITGDSDYIDLHSLSNHNLIITTPEKWDSITRKWRDNKSFIQAVKLFMIDEIHLLNEENRGATLEALVCRMKTIQSTILDELDEEGIYLKQNIRFLTASATFPNIKDVGEWLCHAKYFSFEESIRPVKLHTIVLGYSYNKASTPFKFDITLNYKLPALILKYSNGKPTLIFCSTRKSVEMAVRHLTMTLTIPLNDSQKEILRSASSTITDSKLKASLLHGIGYHHGGLLPEARAIIEQLFRGGLLPVLITTSTLATGVNLPAHLVIIKSTKFYDKGGFQDYSAIAILQMLGRAGRPQFDSEATALILTSIADKEKFEKMTDGKKEIESNLHRHLTEHLNAEIVLGTITDLDVAMRWLSSTFLYIRARQNPRHYGIPLGLTSEKIDKKLLEVCQIDLNKLVKAEMATMDEDINIKCTDLGELMAKYYMSFETMKLFKTLTGNEILQQILSAISKCQEFSDMRLRVDEKKCLNLLNKNKNKNSIRFPFSGKIKTIEMKINCSIQAIFGCLEIEDHSILTEAFRIMRLGERICRCLIEYWKDKSKCYSALLNTIILWKCFRAQLWENSPHVAKQFPGIGLITSNQLVNAGQTSINKIIKTNPREIEMITKKKPPFGNKIIDMANTIPRYDIDLEKISQGGQYSLKLVLTLLNPDCLKETPVVSANDIMTLFIGDNRNNILLYERYMHSHMLENNKVVKLISINEEVNEVHCHFISENIVGIDLNASISMKNNQESTRQDNGDRSQTKKVKKNDIRTKTAFKKLDEKYANFVQTYIDSYLKCKKNNENNASHKPKRAIIEPVKKDLSKYSTVEETPKDSFKVNTLEGIDNIQSVQYGGIDNFSRSENRSVAPENVYSLSSFEETTETPQYTIEQVEDILNQTKSTSSHEVSLTDAEIAQHIEVILDKNSEQDDIKKGQENSLELKQSTNQPREELKNFDIGDEFAMLHDKYGMKQDQKGQNFDIENSISNFSRCQDVSNSRKLSQNKGKLHSAKSFENALFNPNTDSLNSYRYKPNKRFSHNSFEVGHHSASQSKRRKSEISNDKLSDDMMKNLDKYIEPNEKESQYAKSIKWRSPLVYSPPVKYSPKISTSFSFSIPMPKNNESEFSHDWSMTSQDTNYSSKNLRTPTTKVTPRRKNINPEIQTKMQGNKFLLADKEYENDNNEELSDISNSLQASQSMCNAQTPGEPLQYQDIISSSFLEDVGLTKSPRATSNFREFSQKSNPNALEMTVGNYYHDLVARDKQIQTNPHYPTHGKTPFYLKQNINDWSSDVPYRKEEMIPPINGFGANQSFYEENLRQRLQKRLSEKVPTPHNMKQHYPDGFWVSNNDPYSLQNRENNSIVASNLTGFIGFTPSHTKSFDQTNVQNRPEVGIVRPAHQDYFQGSSDLNQQKKVSAYSHPCILPSGYSRPSQDHLYLPHPSRIPLHAIDQNEISTQKKEMQKTPIFYPNDVVNSNGASIFPSHGFGNVNEYPGDLKAPEYGEKFRQHPGHEWRNCLENIQPEQSQIGFGDMERNGYFLNEYQYPATLRRDIGNTHSTWNNICSVHRLFNCPMCKFQPYPSPATSLGNAGRNSLQKHIYPVDSNSSNHLSQPAEYSSYQGFNRTHESMQKPTVNQLEYQCPNHTNSYQPSAFNAPYLSRSNQQVAVPNRQHTNSNLMEDDIQGDSDFFQNYRTSQRGSRNDENFENMNYTMEMKRIVDNANKQSHNVQVGNESYLLDKFLHSCENSQKNNEK